MHRKLLYKRKSYEWKIPDYLFLGYIFTKHIDIDFQVNILILSCILANLLQKARTLCVDATLSSGNSEVCFRDTKLPSKLKASFHIMLCITCNFSWIVIEDNTF